MEEEDEEEKDCIVTEVSASQAFSMLSAVSPEQLQFFVLNSCKLRCVAASVCGPIPRSNSIEIVLEPSVGPHWIKSPRPPAPCSRYSTSHPGQAWCFSVWVHLPTPPCGAADRACPFLAQNRTQSLVPCVQWQPTHPLCMTLKSGRGAIVLQRPTLDILGQGGRNIMNREQYSAVFRPRFCLDYLIRGHRMNG